MPCKDPIIDSLKSVGYCAVRLPRASIQPLQFLVRSGREMDNLGELSKVLVPTNGGALPRVKVDIKAANISGLRSGEVSLGLGLSFLGTIIGALGGSKVGLDGLYKRAKSVVFEFDDVLEDKVEVAELDQYLGGSDIDPRSTHVETLLESDDIYVITSIIKCRKFKVEAKTTAGAALDVEVPAIQQVVGAKVKVSHDTSRTTQVAYEGPTHLTFGFQAVRLFYENGKYTAFEPMQGVVHRALAQAPKDGAQRLMVDGLFVRFSK